MIQRKQTVFLVIAVVALLSSFFVPVETSAALSWLPAVVRGLSALIAAGGIFAIFQYADRPRQRATVLALQYAVLAVLVVVPGLNYLLRDVTLALDAVAWAIAAAVAAAPAAIAYVMFLMARKYIEHDIALVRSMDRLR